MSSRFQTVVVLGSSLVYPNAVVWSQENLIAVACGSSVVILNPANPVVRGLITAPPSKPFPLGVVDGGGQDLLSGCLLPCHLSRDARPCVRSISWSPVGLSENAGCLLAVCTVSGRVKLYGHPFCEFSAEWVEIVDVSELLFDYFSDADFQDFRNSSASVATEAVRRKRRRKDASCVAAKDSSYGAAEGASQGLQIVPLSACKRLRGKETGDQSNLPVIDVQEYATRNGMLSSLTVSWSPILGESWISVPGHSSDCCSILAVGGKCGRVSLWRVRAPESYSIVKRSRSSGSVTLVSILKAHDTWVTAIDWARCGCDSSSTAHLVLATGSSNGRVRIWQLNNDEELLRSSDVIQDSFFLLKEIVTCDFSAISVLSLAVPSNSAGKLHVAIGGGSGMLEVWILDVPSMDSIRIGRYIAHDRLHTGLSWAFDGRCLYSCSQENSLKCWILAGDSMQEVPFSSGNLVSKGSPDDDSHAFDSCYGLAPSPGNLLLAVARGFDVDQLNPMYEGKTHKTALEFLWIAGQEWNSSNHRATHEGTFQGSLEKELALWKSNILWSLSWYECFDRVLNVWDVVIALCALKHSEPMYAEGILLEWLASCFKSKINVAFALSSKTFEFLRNLSSRQLHLINIITRHVVLTEDKEDDKSVGEEQLRLWSKLLSSSESQLLERLVCLNFSAVLRSLSDSSAYFTCSSHCGLAQMKQWVSAQEDHINIQTKVLAAQFKKADKSRLGDVFGHEANEQCSFCSAAVPFESTDYAVCLGANDDSQRHKLARCSATMRVLPTKPSWYCVSCRRWSAHLAPKILFEMHGYPSDFESFLDSYACTNSSVPCCPLCGILLQRSQPGHCLSPSPV